MKIVPAMLLSLLATVSAVEPPVPYGPLPSERQLKWHELETYAFIHFTTNTFTGREWGYGDESPKVFNPSAFDADQIVGTIADAGLKAVMLTCKHHDGFCIWPSAFTDHSVKASPWLGGKGDVVRAISDACRKRGLAFGVYLSPWDRNQATYGTPEYITYFRNQLRELLTNYGPIFEIWFDGANGGDGYYGGAKEKRKIDNRTYYDWPNTIALIRELQPEAALFSGGGPDIRWVGNESGIAGEPCWATIDATGWEVGNGNCKNPQRGQRPGTHWMPAEADVSTRPGWFWHESQNNQVKSPAELLKIYFESVGRGAGLILNIPPDRRGVIHENDVAALKGWKALLDATFATDLAQRATISASNVRGGDKTFASAKVLDGKRDTYWATDNGVTTGELVLDFDKEVTFNIVRLREYLPLGQRIEGVALDVQKNGAWEEATTATSIGSQRLLVTNNYLTTKKLRLRVTMAAACPAISELGVFAMPMFLEDPVVNHARDGWVNIALSRSGPLLRYTLDGSEPNAASPLYTKPFRLPRGGIVKVMAMLPDGSKSSVITGIFDLATARWKAVGDDKKANQAFDDKKATVWQASGKAPQSLVIDMGANEALRGISILPRQDGSIRGMPDLYEVSLSADGKEWGRAVASGEFSNIRANPVRQVITFAEPANGRFLRFTVTRTVDGNEPTVAELGAITR